MERKQALVTIGITVALVAATAGGTLAWKAAFPADEPKPIPAERPADERKTEPLPECADDMWVEQTESKVNLERLANGEVKSFGIGQPTTTDDETLIPITMSDADGNTTSGTIRLVTEDNKVYLTGVWRGETKPDKDEFTGEPDTDILAAMVAEQVANQESLVMLKEGKFKSAELGEPREGASTKTIEATLTTTSGDTYLTNITLIKHTTGNWYVTGTTDTK